MIKATKARFVKGDRVATKVEYDDDETLFGTVVRAPKTTRGAYTIRWDAVIHEPQYEDEPAWTNNEYEEYLTTPEEVRSKKMELETEFRLLEAEIGDKVQVASNLIKEASDLAKARGKSLYDLPLSEPLENVLSQAGWSSSSWGC